MQPLGLLPGRSRLILAAVCTLLLGCRSAGPEVVIHASDGNQVRVRVELARTEAERRRGLMYRKDLPADAGMLFLFPQTAEHRFWMKNTPAALDMIFIAEDGRIVGIVENARPFTTNPRGVAGASRFVLEVHAGFTHRHAIRAGDRVDILIESLPESSLKSTALHNRSNAASAN